VRDTYKVFLVYKLFPTPQFFEADPAQNEILLESTEILQLQSSKIGSRRVSHIHSTRDTYKTCLVYKAFHLAIYLHTDFIAKVILQ
jgi:hypothetical protein